MDAKAGLCNWKIGGRLRPKLVLGLVCNWNNFGSKSGIKFQGIGKINIAHPLVKRKD